jgi:hypothetical protein
MAINMKALLAQARREKKDKDNNNSPSNPVDDAIIETAERQGLAIRFCSPEEVTLWQAGAQTQGQGAAFSLVVTPYNLLRTRLDATVSFGMSMRPAPQRLMVLKDAGHPLSQVPEYFVGTPEATLTKLHNVFNSRTTMVAWMDLTAMSLDQAVNMVIAIMQDNDIVSS